MNALADLEDIAGLSLLLGGAFGDASGPNAKSGFDVVKGLSSEIALLGSTCLGVVKTAHSLAANSFGMCSGMARASKNEPSLTEWIDEQIQAAAGRLPDAAPVTFSDLWNAPLYDGEAPTSDKTIQLQVVTTSVTEGRPYSIPFRSGTL